MHIFIQVGSLAYGGDDETPWTAIEVAGGRVVIERETGERETLGWAEAESENWNWYPPVGTRYACGTQGANYAQTGTVVPTPARGDETKVWIKWDANLMPSGYDLHSETVYALQKIAAPVEHGCYGGYVSGNQPSMPMQGR